MTLGLLCTIAHGAWADDARTFVLKKSDSGGRWPPLSDYSPCDVVCSYGNMRWYLILFLQFNYDLFSVVDIHTGLGRLAAYLEALQRPPVIVVVSIVSGNGADA